MAIANTLKEFLSDHHIMYELVPHRHTDTSFNSAISAHLPATLVVKAVIVQNKKSDLLMVALPCDHQLQLDVLNDLSGCEYHFVSEEEISRLFEDCEPGAIPALGEAYNMEMFLDEHLFSGDPVYIEAGDHENLVKLGYNLYRKLVMGSASGNIQGKLLGKPKTEYVTRPH